MKTKRLFLTLATALLASIGMMAQESSSGETLNVNRDIEMGYGASTATVDFTAAKTFLGVEEVTTDMLRVVHPNGTHIASYGEYDGWFATTGIPTQWSDLSGGPQPGICVKFYLAIDGGNYTICDMNGADVVGTTYTVKWALVANGKTYTYTINVTFKNPDVVELPYGDLTEELDVTYGVGEVSYTEKWVSLSTDQQDAICDALGIDNVSDATVYGYNPSDGSLITNYARCDGWRDANGDFDVWTGDKTVPFCVKMYNGVSYVCYNLIGCSEQTVPVYWALANDEKYVLVKINFTYEASTYTLSISDAGYATYYSDCAYTMPEGLTGYIVEADGTEGVVKFVAKYAAGDVVPYWTGVLLKGAEGTYTADCVSGDYEPYTNRLGGVTDPGLVSAWEDNILLYKLADGENGLGWYWASDDGRSIYCAANRCYLWLTETEAGYNGSSAGAAPRFISLPGDEATGISAVGSKAKGSVSYFDLQGRRVAQPTKGLYIVTSEKGSKKVFIK